MMKTKDEPEIGDFLQSIRKLADATQKLTRQAVKLYSEEVERIFRMQDHDLQRIERCLDGMLDFCFDDSMPALYKKLCRYYFKINPSATISYVNFYREMWDNQEELGDKKECPL